jgi:methyltransferase (TIGR00027 family)
MKRDTASRTAMWVAFMRALADRGHTGVRGFSDPTARELLDPGWRRRLEKAEQRLKSRRSGFGAAMTQNGIDLLALRTVFIDEAVTREVERGTRQLVILGAGLDGRAWRLPSLAGVSVFEVDHPSTQAAKRARLGALKPVAARIDFVPVDFEQEGFDAALASAGHDATQPTVWLWEGVVMYLTPPAVRSTLRSVSSRSAPGSALVVNYHTGLRQGFVGLLLRFLGEPNRSAFTREELQRELQAAGFAVEVDECVADWQRRYGGAGNEFGTAKVTRIAVARR